MRLSISFSVPKIATTLTVLATTAFTMAQAQAQAQSTPRVLVFTATTGYRHDSIPTSIQVLGENASKYGVEFVFSEDSSQFSNETLSGFDGVMFVSTTGEQLLDESGQAALQTFFQSGGTYTGVHAAADCLNKDETYFQALGAYFDYHPTLQSATFERLNNSHPATANVPDRWTFEEEVYHFRSDPRDNGAVVLMTVDESSYVNNASSSGNYPSMGDPHPIAWYIESMQSAQPLLPSVEKAGRSFYTSLGHLNSTWQDDTFITHVMSGLKWALDGASTKAYGVGIVGNGNGASNSTNGTSSGTAASTSSSASGASTSAASMTTSPASAIGSGSGASAGASQSAGGSSNGASALGMPGKAVALAVGLLGMVGIGAGLLL